MLFKITQQNEQSMRSRKLTQENCIHHSLVGDCELSDTPKKCFGICRGFKAEFEYPNGGGETYTFNPNDILKAPANYLLQDCLKQLKFGRPASDQKLIDKFIDITKLCYDDETLEDEFTDELCKKTIKYLESLGFQVQRGKITEPLKELYEAYYYMYKENIDNFLYYGTVHSDIEEEKKQPAENPNIFTSKFGLDAPVALSFTFGSEIDDSTVDGVIESVKFTREGKVRYDIACAIRDTKSKDMDYTIIRDVDSTFVSEPETVMEKCETRTKWICQIEGHPYVRTLIDWNDERPMDITWHRNFDQKEGESYLTEKELEEYFQKWNVKPIKEDGIVLIEE
jgi:hypothetical protein